MNFKKIKTKLHQYFSKHKRLPSYKEMADLLGFASKKSAFYWTKKLIEKSFLAKDEVGKLIPGERFFSIPLLGSIKAGIPDTPYQDFMERVILDKYLVKNLDKAYALKVSGDSMINAGIYEGDVVVIEKDKQAKNGDIVVACVDEEFTLKYLHLKDNKSFLAAANPKYKNIYPQEKLTIFGVVVSVIRKFF